MSPISKTTFKDWQKEQLKNPEFAAIARELEPLSNCPPANRARTHANTIG